MIRKHRHSPRLNIRLNPPLTQGLLNSQLNRVLTDGGVTLGDNDDIAADIGPFLGQWVDDLVVDVVPVLPGEVLHVNPNFVEPAFAFNDLDATAGRPSPLPIFACLTATCADLGRRYAANPGRRHRLPALA